MNGIHSRTGQPLIEESIVRSLSRFAAGSESHHEMTHEDLVVNVIKNIFPLLHLENPRLIDSGWCNVIIVFDEQYVFKLPRFRKEIPNLLNEISLLENIDFAICDVPHYLFKHERDGFAVAGYKYIAGSPISELGVLSLSLKRQLKNALQFIHSIPLDSISKHGNVTKSAESWLLSYGKYFRNLRKKHAGVLGPRLADSLDLRFREFRLDFFDKFTPVLIHGDFYRNNLLVDKEGLKLTGILDWGDAVVGGDPALDIAAISIDYGESTLEFFSDAYAESDPSFVERARFYMDVEPLIGLDQGVLLNNSEKVEENLEKLKIALEKK